MGVHREKLDVLELIGSKLFDVFLNGARGGLGLAAHERQLEYFGLGETARRVAQHGPGDVGDAVTGLVKQLGRRAAQLHGMEQLHLDSATRLGFDLLRPGHQCLGRNRCLGR